jgi:pilus assembly protein FimV
MRSSTRSTLSSFKLKTLSAAFVSALILSGAHAAGLGKLTVLSSLGQPLRAEIELTSVAPDEAGTLVPRLAPAAAFQQANIEMNPTLLSLRFAVEQRASGPVIRVTSTQAINEPYVDMLLELGGSKGSFIREYTFLLDPPELRTQQSAQIGSATSARSLPAPATKPVPAAAPAAVPAPAPSAEAERPAAAPAARPAKSETVAAAPKPERAEGEEYKVKKGDTLAKVAGQYQGDGVSLDQMLVAMYRANPDAFVGKNMNRLRAGAILSVPSADEAKSVGAGEAHGVVRAQATDFNAYRSKLANQVASATPKESDESRQAASGKITAKVQDEAGNAGASKDKLKLSKSGAGAPGNEKAGPSAEEMIAKDKALEEANARVKELEKNVNQLQQLLEVKNRDLAAQQKQAEASKTAAAPAPVVPPVTAPASAPAATVTAPASSVAATTTPTSSTAAEPASAVAAAPVTPPVAKPKHRVVAPPPPPPEPSFLEDLTGNPLFLPGAAVLLALLAGLGIYSARRRKQVPAKSFEDSVITDSTLKSNSLFGSTGGQSVDTNNSVFNSNFVPSASQLDTNEVDPIAEADVYIAYGRDAQAEEILKEALRNQPDRHAVRVKLLEIYANRKDVRSFEILATELYSLTRGQGDDWQQAANLGAMLDPGNPLYSSGNTGVDVTSHTASLDTKTRPIDEPGLDALLETTQVKPGANAVNTIESSPYFGSTTLLADDALSIPTAPQTTTNHKPEEVEDLDFDLDGLELDSGTKKEAEASAPEMPAEIASLDLDFLDKKSEETKEPAPELNDLSFDLKDEPAAPAPTPTAAAPEVLVPEAMGLDFPGIPPTSQTEAAKPAERPEMAEAPMQDLGGALDLPALEGLSDDEQYSGSAEMATKLDLAIAYQEIGDKEGARELLEEVVKGGNSEQIDKARNLLAKLA